jgi:hypothetical protein
VRGPNLPEVAGLVSELHAQREEAIAILEGIEGKPPSLAEVSAAIPPGVRLLSYRPKQAPFALTSLSVVTSAGIFFRAYLRDLGWRLEHPEGHAAAPLPDILSKLADAGLELQLAPPRVGSGTCRPETETSA